MSTYKLNEQPSKKKYLYISIVFILILTSFAAVYAVYTKNNTPVKTNPDREVIDSSSSNNKEDESIVVESKEKVEQSPPSTVDTKAQITITEQRELASGIRIAAESTGLVPDKCVFTFSSDDSRPVIKNVDAVDSRCGPIEVSYLEFDKLGRWNVTVTAYNNTARINTESTIEVR